MSKNRIDIEIPVTVTGGMPDASRFLPKKEGSSQGKRKQAKAILFVACLSFVVLICVLVMGAFKIDRINVEGNLKYTDAEIRAISEAQGHGFFSYNTKKSEERIFSSCPLLEKVEVKKSFPNRITITVEECTLAYYTSCGGEWYSFGTNLRFNENSRYNDRFVEAGLMHVTLPSPCTVEVGMVPVFEDDRSFSYIVEFLNVFCQYEFLENYSVSEIDLVKKFDIRVMLADGTEIRLGSTENMDVKINAAFSVIDDMRKREDRPLTINASDPHNVICRVKQ